MNTPYGLKVVEHCTTCELRSKSFFCDLPPTALEGLERVRFATSYPADSVLFVEGQNPRGVYILCKGSVKLTTTSADGKSLILKIARAGEVLGMHSAVAGVPYEVTAETTEPCQLAFIKREDVAQFLRSNGDACLRAAEHLSHDCQVAYQQIRSLGLSHSAPERLARFVLDWSRQNRTASTDSTRFSIGLTHQEIAESIGTSRETVTRVLADFRKRNIVHLKGSTMIIKDQRALERMVAS